MTSAMKIKGKVTVFCRHGVVKSSEQALAQKANGGVNGLWIVVYITQNKETAMTIKKLLRDAGLLVKMRSIGLRSDEQYGCYEILLPESEVEEGHSVIIESMV